MTKEQIKTEIDSMLDMVQQQIVAVTAQLEMLQKHYIYLLEMHVASEEDSHEPV